MQSVDPNELVALLKPQMEFVADLAVRRQLDTETFYKPPSADEPAGQEEDRRARVGVLSQVDLEIQELLLRFILEHWPFVSVMAEETTESRARFSEGREDWILLDPIDGTRNYLHGTSAFCHIVALMKGIEMVASLVYSQTSRRLYTAVAGEGAMAWPPGGEPRKVDIVAKEGRTLLHHVSRVPAPLLAQLESRRYAVSSSSQNATDIVGMLEGGVAGFISVSPIVYDVWAPGMIVREAGGWLSDWQGRAPVFRGRLRVPHLLVSRSEEDARELLPSLAQYAAS